MSSRLIESLATTDALADIFSDVSVLQAMIDVEVALVRAAARAGAIPSRAAEAIATAVRADAIDAAALAREAWASATPVVPLVRALTEQVRAVDRDSAQYVHWGATSQDVTDTALAVLLKRARPVLARDQARIDGALRALSDAHARTVMLGRTLLQPALPVTFGLKSALWCSAVAHAWERAAAAWDDALVVQIGGAAGTRAAMAPHGAVIAAAVAEALDLRVVPPWHTDRGRSGALVAGCGLYTAALGKVARDITLLMQPEVGELAERGGASSAMPHKRNPSGCTVAIAAATRTPGLVAAFLSGMLQEHERSAGGGQAEPPIVAAVVQATGAAAAAMAGVIEGLSVDPLRMRRNLESTGGAVFAERAVVILSAALGRDRAQAVVAAALDEARATGRRFGETLGAMPAAAGAVSADVLAGLEVPEAYLGEAESLRRELLAV